MGPAGVTWSSMCFPINSLISGRGGYYVTIIALHLGQRQWAPLLPLEREPSGSDREWKWETLTPWASSCSSPFSSFAHHATGTLSEWGVLQRPGEEKTVQGWEPLEGFGGLPGELVNPSGCWKWNRFPGAEEGGRALKTTAQQPKPGVSQRRRSEGACRREWSTPATSLEGENDSLRNSLVRRI